MSLDQVCWNENNEIIISSHANRTAIFAKQNCILMNIFLKNFVVLSMIYLLWHYINDFWILFYKEYI